MTHEMRYDCSVCGLDPDNGQPSLVGVADAIEALQRFRDELVIAGRGDGVSWRALASAAKLSVNTVRKIVEHAQS